MNPHAIAELARILDKLCVSDAEATRLTGIILEQCDEWCGPATLRSVYSQAMGHKRSGAGADPYAVWEPSWRREQDAAGSADAHQDTAQ